MRLACCLNQRRRCALGVIRKGLRHRLPLPGVDEHVAIASAGSASWRLCMTGSVSAIVVTAILLPIAPRRVRPVAVIVKDLTLGLCIILSSRI